MSVHWKITESDIVKFDDVCLDSSKEKVTSGITFNNK